MKQGIAFAALSCSLMAQLAVAGATKDCQGKLVSSSATTEQPQLGSKTSHASIDKTNAENIGGNWIGHANSRDLDCSISLQMKQSNGRLEGTLTTVGKEGSAKHYLQGQFDSEQNMYVFKDIGVDLEWGAPGFCPTAVDKYELHLVEDGRKLVGTGHQRSERLWIALSREKPQIQNNGQLSTQNRFIQETSHQTKEQYVAPSFEKNDMAAPTKQVGNTAKSSTTNKLSKPFKIGPEAVSYMTAVERAIKKHWHPHMSLSSRLVTVDFQVNEDGSVSDLTLDDDSTPIDDYTEAAFDAIQKAAPFLPPPQKLVEAAYSDGESGVKIRFSFDYNRLHGPNNFYHSIPQPSPPMTPSFFNGSSGRATATSSSFAISR
ncbi:MAG: energy transducer TonB [Candidatus Obscuribacterales bacterium]|nr:energy transducer TonB [Candidatus Obscuribacterales bacterium]